MTPTNNNSHSNDTNDNNTNYDQGNNADTTTVAQNKVDCDVYVDSFDDENGLNDHMKEKHSAKIKCHQCHRLFKTNEKMIAHLNMRIYRKK